MSAHACGSAAAAGPDDHAVVNAAGVVMCKRCLRVAAVAAGAVAMLLLLLGVLGSTVAGQRAGAAPARHAGCLQSSGSTIWVSQTIVKLSQHKYMLLRCGQDSLQEHRLLQEQGLHQQPAPLSDWAF